jgi:hypothetical protein
MRDAANANLKKVSLELGGKSPLIIFKDADGLYLSITAPQSENFILTIPDVHVHRCPC